MKRKPVPVFLDPELVSRFENAEAINAALRVLVDAAHLVKPVNVTGRASRSKTTKDSDANLPNADYLAAVEALTNPPTPNARLRRAVRRARARIAD